MGTCTELCQVWEGNAMSKPRSIVDRFLAGENLGDIGMSLGREFPHDGMFAAESSIRRALKKARKEAAELRAIAVTPAAKRWRQIVGRGEK